jgi:hypothetical protein
MEVPGEVMPADPIFRKLANSPPRSNAGMATPPDALLTSWYTDMGSTPDHRTGCLCLPDTHPGRSRR